MKIMNLSRCLIIAASVCLIGSGSITAADRYVVDNAHTTVEFRVQHMMLSKVVGRFNQYAGLILWDEKSPQNSTMVGTIDVKSVDTGMALRDDHLRGTDFFNAPLYPQMLFKSRSIAVKNKQIVVNGDFTLHGVTKPVKIVMDKMGPISDGRGSKRIGFTGQFVINRQDYGISFSKTMDNGGLMIGNDVTILLSIEAEAK